MVGWATAKVSLKEENKERKEELIKELLYLEWNNSKIEMLDEESIGGDFIDNLQAKIEPILNKGDRVLFIEANNTTDSGAGILMERTEDGMEEIDEKIGADLARAYDVVSYFNENYDIKGHASLEV